MSERAQVYTLEAFVASFVLLASLVVALQITAVTPLSASTANEHVESQQERLANGVVDAAVTNRSVRGTLLYWNATNGTVYGVGNATTRAVGPPTPFGRLLNRTLAEARYAYNLRVQYITTEGAVRQEALVRMGTPSETAAAVDRTITLYDDDVLVDARGEPTDQTLANASSFYAPDVAPNSSLYNVVRVEVVLWRL